VTQLPKYQNTPFSTFCNAFHIFLALRIERQSARQSKTKNGRLAGLASSPLVTVPFWSYGRKRVNEKLYLTVKVEPYVMLRHSPLSAAATSATNGSGSMRTVNSVGSSIKPVQHHLDRALSHFEGFIVDLMDRITNVRPSSSYRPTLRKRGKK